METAGTLSLGIQIHSFYKKNTFILSIIIFSPIQIRGKDLVGGVMVMPMGLGDAIKKRTSGEFKMEVCIHALLTAIAWFPYPQPQKHNDKIITKSKSVFSVGIWEGSKFIVRGLGKIANT